MVGITGHPVIQRDTADFQALCNELSHFEAIVSHLTDPLEWTHLNKQHFADKLLGTQSAFDGVLVYPVCSNPLNHSFRSRVISTALHGLHFRMSDALLFHRQVIFFGDAIP